MFTDLSNQRGPILQIRGLKVDVLNAVSGRYDQILSDVNICLHAGQALGITGRSGGGKSTLALTLTGLLPASARIEARQWHMFGRSLLSRLDEHAAPQPINTRRILRTGPKRRFLISQDVRSALIPYHTLEWHLRQASRHRTGANRLSISDQLKDLGFQNPNDYLRRLPHELSTGECQRVQLGMAKQLTLDLLIADEPFASVDQKLQNQLVGALRELRANGTAIILISHDLNLLREATDELMVICNGLVAEAGPTKEVLSPDANGHPHTKLLLELSRATRYELAQLSEEYAASTDVACLFADACNRADRTICTRSVPALQGAENAHWYRCDRSFVVAHPFGDAANGGPMYRTPVLAKDPTSHPNNGIAIDVSALGMHWNGPWLFRGWTLAVSSGDRVGLQAPSGSGKSTLGRILMGLLSGAEGRIVRFPGTIDRWEGLRNLRAKKLLWKRIQMVYQDADLSFDPGAPVGESIVQVYRARCADLSADAAWHLASALFARFHLSLQDLLSPPHQLSGGERRRAAIARALAIFGFLQTDSTIDYDRVLILDEPSVGIDLFLQTVVAEQLLIAQKQLSLAYLVLSHDIDFLTRFCNRIYHLELSATDLVAPTSSLRQETG